ncbi:hypothetical protein HPB52_024986 [Rhipicephalus sanguineus]|uniref:Uncharacterized protein n=1 Tax=Rhipicephalus sanguineus TaxID=34632 RepID=A0A9D4YRL7_RHISA|nr:hypothetical protein HPB52_024986 [Rhipicephalus sanguineus]
MATLPSGLPPINVPFRVPNALKVIEYIRDSPPVNCFSIHVKDLFYNIPRKETVRAVEDAIDLFGISKFQDLCSWLLLVHDGLCGRDSFIQGHTYNAAFMQDLASS